MSDIPADPDSGEERIWSFTNAGVTIFMNAAGDLGINIGGNVIIKPVAEWHRLASGLAVSMLDKPLSEIAPPVPEMSPCCGASFKRSGQGLACSECGEWFSVFIVRSKQ